MRIKQAKEQPKAPETLAADLQEAQLEQETFESRLEALSEDDFKDLIEDRVYAALDRYQKSKKQSSRTYANKLIMKNLHNRFDKIAKTLFLTEPVQAATWKIVSDNRIAKQERTEKAKTSDEKRTVYAKSFEELKENLKDVLSQENTQKVLSLPG